MAATRIYGFTVTTGGGVGALDRYPVTGGPALADNDMAFGVSSSGFLAYRYNSASVAAELDPYIISPSDNVGRWELVHNNYELDALLVFGNATGYTTATLLIAIYNIAYYGLKTTLLLRPGVWEITDDITFDEYTNIKIPAGATLNIATGKTVTIHGTIECGDYVIFTGDGSVSFSRETPVIPQWFGETGDVSSPYDHIPIRKAIAAAGMYGTVQYKGLYHLSEGIVLGELQKHIGITGVVPWSTAGTGLIFTAAVTGAAVTCNKETHIRDLNIHCEANTTYCIVVDGTATETFLKASNLNIHGGVVCAYVKNSWLTQFTDCMFRYPTSAGLVVDYCYALDLYNCQFNGGEYSMIVTGTPSGSSVSATACSFEEQTKSGVVVWGNYACANLDGCYIETKSDPAGAGTAIATASNTVCNVRGCHVYMTECATFMHATGNTNVVWNVSGTRFALPSISDATSRHMYCLPTSGSVNISGDMMYETSSSVHYLDSYVPTEGFNITLPHNIHYPAEPMQMIGYPLAVKSNVSKLFAMDAGASSTFITPLAVNILSSIIITPYSKEAAQMQAGTNAIYVSSVQERLSLATAPTPADFAPTDIITSGTSIARIVSKTSSTEYIIDLRSGPFEKGVNITSGGNTAVSTGLYYPAVHGYGVTVSTADETNATGAEKFSILVLN
jgi:hypothetical protein